MMGVDAACGIVRRDFLKLAGAATVSSVARSAFAAGGGRVCLILDPEDALASSGPATRAMGELRRELEAKGIVCEAARTAEAAAGASMCVIAAGRLALDHYRKGREAWAAMAALASHVYRSDVSYGRIPKRRGHWSDRLSGIDVDLAAMQAKVASAAPGSGQSAADAIRAATLKPKRPNVSCSHAPPENFRPGQTLSLSVEIAASGDGFASNSVRLFYRHVNQAKRWISVEAGYEGGHYTGAIPAEYTQSDYPLQYYFELRDRKGGSWMYPGFNKTLSNQPYFAIAKEKA